MGYQSKQFRARMLSLAAALAAASPVPALDACTGASAALAAHHCASLRDLFARAAIVNCSSDPCGCWCARDDDGSAVWRQADQLCSAKLCAEPPQAVDARGEALRRLDGIVGFAVNPIDRSGHHGGHKKLWWEPDCAPSRLNMARWLPACPPAQRMTHRCPLTDAHYSMDPVNTEQYLIMLGACGGFVSIIALIVCSLPRDSLMYRSWFVQL